MIPFSVLFRRNDKIEKYLTNKVGRKFALLLYVTFALIIVLIEEILHAYEDYQFLSKMKQMKQRLKRKSINIRKKSFQSIVAEFDTSRKFIDLDKSEQELLIQYYEFTGKCQPIPVKDSPLIITQITQRSGAFWPIGYRL